MEGEKEMPTNSALLHQTELPLMADGVDFELSGFGEGDVMRTPPGSCMQTAFFFDPGSSSHRPPPAGVRFDRTPHEEVSSGLAAASQFDIISEISRWPQEQANNGGVGGSHSGQGTGGMFCFGGTPNFQEIAQPAGTLLAVLPPNLSPQTFVNNWEPHIQQQRTPGAQNLEFQLLVDMFQKTCARMDNASSFFESAVAHMNENLDSAVACMKEMARAMNDREAAVLARSEKVQKDLTDLRLGRTFQHAAGQAEEPMGSKSELEFVAVRLSVKKFAWWFVDSATAEQLRGAWIQFDDSPRVGIDGYEIKNWGSNQHDMTEQMGAACIRYLKKREGKKSPESIGKTHFVIKDWADLAMKGGSTPDECAALFERPKRMYRLDDCRRIVPFIFKDGQWLSLSIDLVNKETLLIHPAATGVGHECVREVFEPLMRHLTFIALSNMTSLSSLILTSEDWSFGVALKMEHPVGRNNLGATTMFYSIPKENQFMIVSEASIDNSKHAFIHSLVKCCQRITGRKVQIGAKVEIPKESKKRKLHTIAQQSQMEKPRDTQGKWIKQTIRNQVVNADHTAYGKTVVDDTSGSTRSSDAGSNLPSALAAAHSTHAI